MPKISFGTDDQISFENEHEYYRALGYLCRDSSATSINWENNEQQGAWGSEGRIHFYIENPNIPGKFRMTAGTGNICSRVNCNEFVKNLVSNCGFQYGRTQNIENVRSKIPEKYKSDFDNGIAIID